MSKEAMKLALEALESVTRHFTRTPSTLRDSEVRGEAHKAITALREALAEQPAQQEPVAQVIDDGTPEGATKWIPFKNRVEPLKTGDLLYTSPPAQRTWVGLTPEELDEMFSKTLKGKKLVNWVARAIEAKLKEKNT